MAFNIFRWIFGGDKENTGPATRVAVKDFLDNETDMAMDAISVYIQRMAFWTCVRRIGDALGAVEWETYRRGKKVRSGEYWAWNYSPNPKQTRQEFMSCLVAQLYLHQEALVVEYHEFQSTLPRGE